jgi:hypothetical protein
MIQGIDAEIEGWTPLLISLIILSVSPADSFYKFRRSRPSGCRLKIPLVSGFHLSGGRSVFGGTMTLVGQLGFISVLIFAEVPSVFCDHNGNVAFACIRNGWNKFCRIIFYFVFVS